MNHNGWIDIFVLKENYFFCSYFWHISLCFYSNFDRESSLDAEFDSASNEYPHYILLTDPAAPKTRNTWKNVMMNLSKNTMRYVENTNKKSSFLLWQICQLNHYGSLILLKFYWFLNSNSQNLLLTRFLIRPILDPKFPLMWTTWLYESNMKSESGVVVLSYGWKYAANCWWCHEKYIVFTCYKTR